MDKIIGNTVGVPNPQPDWNQTDKRKADYIKNKPNISEYTIRVMQEDLNNVHKEINTATERVTTVEESQFHNVREIATLQNRPFTKMFIAQVVEIDENTTRLVCLNDTWNEPFPEPYNGMEILIRPLRPVKLYNLQIEYDDSKLSDTFYNVVTCGTDQTNITLDSESYHKFRLKYWQEPDGDFCLWTYLDKYPVNLADELVSGILPIEKGGTGANNTYEALGNLGAVDTITYNTQVNIYDERIEELQNDISAINGVSLNKDNEFTGDNTFNILRANEIQTQGIEYQYGVAHQGLSVGEYLSVGGQAEFDNDIKVKGVNVAEELAKIGDIETALDNIIAIQNVYIGGVSE